MNKIDWQTYTPEDILSMDYNQLIGIVRETNRPPGGANSIYRISQRAFLKPSNNILEVGTSTGFTAIEFAALIGCRVTAIDINPLSIEEAKTRSNQSAVINLVDFQIQDTTRMTFKDGNFDMVFCGNVTSLINDKEKAITEYCRVLKNKGYLAAIPMYYIREPADEIISKVSDAIKVRIEPRYRNFWMNFFGRQGLSLYWFEDYAFDRISDTQIEDFVSMIFKRKHLQNLLPESRRVLYSRYREFMFLFRDNLSLMGYTLLLLRKESVPLDPELFTSKMTKTNHIG